MKDRLLTLALAIAAFAVFYALIAPRSDVSEPKPTRPISIEAGPNGYVAMHDWLLAEGVNVISFRERYGKLMDIAPGASGNLLITTAPPLRPMRDSETAPLRNWVAQGNTLLVAAALSDTPDWSMSPSAGRVFMHLRSLTGLRFTVAGDGDEDVDDEDEDDLEELGDADEEAAEQQEKEAESVEGVEEVDQVEEVEEVQDIEEAGEIAAGNAQGENKTESENRKNTTRRPISAWLKLTEPQRFELEPYGDHPLLDGVQSAAALSEYPTSKWIARTAPDRLILELARDPESNTPVLWLMRYGEGQIIVSGYGSLFTNKLLGEADNAQLLSNIVKWSVAPGGAVMIDDAHQGLVSYYDERAFFGDRRLHVSLAWLVALWLIFVLGPQRLRMNKARWTPVDITSFVKASGGFIARVSRPDAVAQRLFDNFFHELRPRSSSSDGTEWEWLAAHTAVSDADIAQLRQLHSRALQGRRVDLRKVQTLLAKVRRAIN